MAALTPSREFERAWDALRELERRPVLVEIMVHDGSPMVAATMVGRLHREASPRRPRRARYALDALAGEHAGAGVFTVDADRLQAVDVDEGLVLLAFGSHLVQVTTLDDADEIMQRAQAAAPRRRRRRWGR